MDFTNKTITIHKKIDFELFCVKLSPTCTARCADINSQNIITSTKVHFASIKKLDEMFFKMVTVHVWKDAASIGRSNAIS